MGVEERKQPERTLRSLAMVPCDDWFTMLGTSAVTSFPDREVSGCRCCPEGIEWDMSAG